MPSFPFFSKRASQQIDRNGGSVVLDSSAQKLQRSGSKRDYFRKLLKRSSISHSHSSRLRKDTYVPPSSSPGRSQKSPEHPTGPMSYPTNKPLPPPPAPGTVGPEPPLKAPKKLERIMAPLAPPDLHKLFSGAPQFFARSEGHHTGAPHPSVAFPWNKELEIRDLTDHMQIQDEAWGSVTAWPHITLQVSRNPEATKEHYEKQKAHFLPRCRERPNMLSMQGIERGTIGYQATLEMGVADALQVPEQISDGSPDVISDHRRKFLNGKDGLRPLTDSMLIEKLLEVSSTYYEDPMKHRRPTIELYTALFTQILFPPSRVTDSEDPYSLQVQIEVLIEVLAAPLVWVDFSLVEWRIRLGQILWGATPELAPEDEVVVNNEVIQEPLTEKYWLLLQILLSCELLIRLDAVSINMDHEIEAIKPAEISRFEKTATPTVRWSVILARHWLENIKIDAKTPLVTTEKKPAGWLATLTGSAGTEIPVNDTLSHVRFEGRHQTRQLSGLVHFSRKLKWPTLEALSAKVSSNSITISDSIQSTPAGTPRSMTTQHSNSYFSRRPGARRGRSYQSRMSAVIHPAGWLSNLYISGLILPGEGLSHFLISTLLENDGTAVSKLGEEVNLYGGFVYGGKSFWSTACIVGRVLAAGKGASECMGWISSDIAPRGAGEGWVDIDVETLVEADSDKKGYKPRIWHKTTIERNGHVIGGADASSVLPGDFILPSDESTQRPLSVTFESLDFFAAVDSAPGTPTKQTPTPLTDGSEVPAIKTYSAMMRFSIEADAEAKKEVNVSLSNDVLFLTAHPCVPSQHTEMLKSPTSPSFQNPEAIYGSETSGHPLHKAFTFTKISLYQLLSTPSSIPLTSLLSPAQSLAAINRSQSSTHTTSSSIPRVLIIDCTDSTMNNFPQIPTIVSPLEKHTKHNFGSDLEMLARALCAERGWNALVSRRGRGCLACAVREAGAVGWRVVLRVA